MAKNIDFYAADIDRILGDAIQNCAWANGSLWFEAENGNFSATIPEATTTRAGLMSAQSYTELYNLRAKYNALALTPIPTQADILDGYEDVEIIFTSINGRRIFSATIESATEDTAGLMSARDKTALNALKTPRPIIIEIYEAANILNVKQATTKSYDEICYNTRTGRLVAKSNLTYYNNWVGADQYGTEMDQNGWEPFVDAFYFCNGNILKYDGAVMWRVAMEILQ